MFRSAEPYLAEAGIREPVVCYQGAAVVDPTTREFLMHEPLDLEVAREAIATLIRRDFEGAFRQCEVVAIPTTPTPAFRIGEKTADPLQMYLSDIFTATINLVGIPALSLPCGIARDGLPIGAQIVGPAFSEEHLLRVAAALESEMDFRSRHRPKALDA